MLLSMTGQGAAQDQQDGLLVAAEVRAVNSRYYKLALRTSEGYSTIESRVDELVRKHVRRGAVQVDLRVVRKSQPDAYRINEVVLASYRDQLESFAGGAETAAISLEALLLLPGVVEEPIFTADETDADWPLIRKTVMRALTGLGKMRTEEGRAMADDLASNCAVIRQQLESVAERAPVVVEQFRERITDRVNKMLTEFEVRLGPDDVIREVALFAEKSDVAEEVVRLTSHLDQFQEIMNLPESAGRKLEFVTQEMFREANTIGSKANDSEIARNVVEIKAAIERIREMIQNIE